MKKIVMTLAGLLVFTCMLAQTTDESAVTMVKYQQSWLDTEATIALKNNTNEDIENVKFRICYLDSTGTQVDYKEFTRDVTIAPGLTKQINIRAFDDSRYSHYVKSNGGPTGEGMAFDVKFELLDYNQPFALSLTDSDMPNIIGIGVILFVMLFFLVIGVLLLILVGKMARARNRSVLLWVLLAIVISPLPIIIILLIIGEDTSKAPL